MRRVNLIPYEARKKSIISDERQFRIIKLGIILFILLLCWQMSALFRYQININIQNKQIAELQQELAESNEIFKALKQNREAVNNQRKLVAQRLSLLQETRERGIPWSKVLIQLGELVPSKVWLKKMMLNGKMLTLEGASTESTRVSDFMAQIDNSNLFERTGFNYMQKNEAKDSGGSLISKLRPIFWRSS
jgi:Tfp pilus assembly protein PilN